MKILLEIRVLPKMVAALKSAYESEIPVQGCGLTSFNLRSNVELMRRVWASSEYREPHVEIPFEVDPTNSVGSVRQIIKDLYPWLKEYQDCDLLIVHARGYKPLMDDNSTLEECMIKDGDKILISHWDEFPLPVYAPLGSHWLVVKVSPFHTLRQFKDRFYQLRPDYPPEKQSLIYRKFYLDGKDDVTLLSLGIGRPKHPWASLTVLRNDYVGPCPC